MIKSTKIQTPPGEMVAGATEDGICLLEFTGGLKRKKWLLDHERRFSGKAVDQDLF